MRLSECGEEEEERGQMDPARDRARGIGIDSLTPRCHIFVTGNGALERPPLTPELIRRPPVPARVGKLAPDYLALVENGDGRDPGWVFHVNFFISVSGYNLIQWRGVPVILLDLRERDGLLVHKDERVHRRPFRPRVFVAAV
jgi:hypothetical protein